MRYNDPARHQVGRHQKPSTRWKRSWRWRSTYGALGIYTANSAASYIAPLARLSVFFSLFLSYLFLLFSSIFSGVLRFLLSRCLAHCEVTVVTGRSYSRRHSSHAVRGVNGRLMKTEYSSTNRRERENERDGGKCRRVYQSVKRKTRSIVIAS